MLTTVDPRAPARRLARSTRIRCPSWRAPMVGTRTSGRGKRRLRRCIPVRDLTMRISFSLPWIERVTQAIPEKVQGEESQRHGNSREDRQPPVTLDGIDDLRRVTQQKSPACQRRLHTDTQKTEK